MSKKEIGKKSKRRETGFFREDDVKEIKKKVLRELGERWGKLYDESAEQSKDALNDLALLLTYLMMDLKADPYIEKYFEMLESKVAIDMASSSLKLAREIANTNL